MDAIAGTREVLQVQTSRSITEACTAAKVQTTSLSSVRRSSVKQGMKHSV